MQVGPQVKSLVPKLLRASVERKTIQSVLAMVPIEEMLSVPKAQITLV